jgi:hypothetical protein
MLATRVAAGPAGLEPATRCLGGSCALQAAPRTVGDAGRTRTGRRRCCGPPPTPVRSAPWRPRLESNQRSPDSESGVLSPGPRGHKSGLSNVLLSAREELNLHCRSDGVTARWAHHTAQLAVWGWGALRDSNPLKPRFTAESLSHLGQGTVLSGGIEPPASSVWARRSSD